MHGSQSSFWWSTRKMNCKFYNLVCTSSSQSPSNRYNHVAHVFHFDPYISIHLFIPWTFWDPKNDESDQTEDLIIVIGCLGVGRCNATTSWPSRQWVYRRNGRVGFQMLYSDRPSPQPWHQSFMGFVLWIEYMVLQLWVGTIKLSFNFLFSLFDRCCWYVGQIHASDFVLFIIGRAVATDNIP